MTPCLLRSFVYPGRQPEVSSSRRTRLGSRTTDRAQSEVVGVLLLTAVIAILVGLFGAFYLDSVNDDRGDGPLLDLAVDGTDTQLQITHAGGESVPLDELSVVLQRESRTERIAFDSADVRSDRDEDDPDRFEPTERFLPDHAFGEAPIQVRVIHDPSNTVLKDAHIDLAAGSSTATTASFTHSPDEPAVGETVTFDASAATGTEGVQRYEWDWDGDSSADASTTEATTTRDFDEGGDHDVTLTVVAEDGSTDEATRTVTVVSTAPTIESTSLTDGDDDIVSDGDEVTVTATVADENGDVDAVTVDASAFDAGAVTLADGDGDGTHEGTFAVGASATEGDQTVTVEAVDEAGNTASVETDDAVTVDTTAPVIETFDVTDESGYTWIIFPYVSYSIDWSVSDEHLASTSVYVNDSTASDNPQDMYAGASGSEEYQRGQSHERTYEIRLVATDEVGNKRCVEVVDEPNDGTDQPSSSPC